MSTSTRIHILLPEDTLARLDMKRGLVPRSSYVRALIDSALSDGQPVIAHRLQFHEDDDAQA